MYGPGLGGLNQVYVPNLLTAAALEYLWQI